MYVKIQVLTLLIRLQTDQEINEVDVCNGTECTDKENIELKLDHKNKVIFINLLLTDFINVIIK